MELGSRDVRFACGDVCLRLDALAIAMSNCDCAAAPLGADISMRWRSSSWLSTASRLSQGGFRCINIDFERPSIELVEDTAGFNKSLPCSKLRLTTIPDTRARTSAIRVGAMRPGNSRITASGAGCNSTTLTSESQDCPRRWERQDLRCSRRAVPQIAER